MLVVISPAKRLDWDPVELDDLTRRRRGRRCVWPRPRGT